MIYKGGNFCDFLFAFLHANFLIGANLFLLELTPFQEEDKTNWQLPALKIVSVSFGRNNADL